MTVKVVVPLTIPEAAVIVVVPSPAPVASPVKPNVATAVFEEDQLAVFVKSLVLLSLNEPVAVNCRVAPVWIDAVAGAKEIDTKLGEAGLEFETV